MGCTEDVEVFPSQISAAYPSPDWQYEDGRYHAKDYSVRQNSRVFWLYGASHHPQPPRNQPHLSALICLSLFPMLDEHTLHYAHLQSNKETAVWTRAFSPCMSPTVQMAVSIRNSSVASFCEDCVLWRVFGFHLTALIISMLEHHLTILISHYEKVYNGFNDNG